MLVCFKQILKLIFSSLNNGTNYLKATPVLHLITHQSKTTPLKLNRL